MKQRNIPTGESMPEKGKMKLNHYSTLCQLKITENILCQIFSFSVDTNMYTCA